MSGAGSAKLSLGAPTGFEAGTATYFPEGRLFVVNAKDTLERRPVQLGPQHLARERQRQVELLGQPLGVDPGRGVREPEGQVGQRALFHAGLWNAVENSNRDFVASRIHCLEDFVVDRPARRRLLQSRLDLTGSNITGAAYRQREE